ncbi:GlsB/YeaQ/YmgE family stress response membrane protein [Pinirhizobacter soli]|uniref:GlsB/YeaQ/YmgE family stress response membrane protein n=1 Tax=Pinirhizobacter soli TaxID=2786953 RepID=UPI002029D32A|nr:GlsB/YeaQ/YmgE family stress response membrane protein [Pinirhizobacter soli]
MHWLWAFLIGLVVGIIAKFLVPGKDPGGFIITGLLGIAGSLLASWAGQQLGWYGPEDSAGFIASVVGAIVLLLIWRMFRRRSA